VTLVSDGNRLGKNRRLKEVIINEFNRWLEKKAGLFRKEERLCKASLRTWVI
jgi:hypothetical protein